MIGQKFLYQIGDPLQDRFVLLIPQEGTAFDIQKGIKSRQTENAFIDGSDDNYRFQEAYTMPWTYNATISRTDEMDWNYVQKMKRPKLKLFFIEIPNLISDPYKIYYTYGRYLSGLPDKYSAGGGIESGSKTAQTQSIQLVFEISTPFYFLTDTDLKLLDHKVTGPFLTWGDSIITFGDASVDYGVTNPNYEIEFNTLTRQNQNTYLSNLCNPEYQFTFADKFIKNQPYPEVFAINTDQSFNTTLTTNNSVILSSNNLNLLTTEKSYFNLIKLDITGGFATNEWVEITNLNTGTGFRFTWNATANSSASLLVNTAQVSNMVTDLVLGAVIDPIDSNGNSNYTIQAIDTATELLVFNNYLKPVTDSATRFNLPNTSSDNLELIKNTSANLTITIKNLLTFS